MSLIHPVKKVHITQDWGVNEAIYRRFGLSGHNGVDYRVFDDNGKRATYGKSYAPHTGKIIEASNNTNGYGWYVKIENDKEGSILGHHKELMVKVGDVVKQGDYIGITDNTGWSTGPHLHWGYYLKPRNKANGYSGTINQLLLIGETMPDTIPVKKKVFEELVTKSTKYDKFKKMGYNEPSKIKEDIEECARRLVELRTSEQNATRLSKSLMLEAVKIVEALGLVENSENKAVLAAIKSLMEEPIVEEPQNGSQSDRLPKTYNGYKITGITLKP